jgi:hypothetical protein
VTGPTALAHAIVDELRDRHGDCTSESCHLAQLWAEDVDEVLELAADLMGASEHAPARPIVTLAVAGGVL